MENNFSQNTPLPLKNTIIYHCNTLILLLMTLEQALQKDIEDSQRWLNLEKEESTYKRDLAKRIELINWVLENMKNPNVQICELMESRLNEIILKINQTHDIFDSDKIHSELRILDYLFYHVCKDQQKRLVTGL